MVDPKEMMEKASAMQQSMEQVADDMKKLELVGEAAGGMVRVIMNGKGEVIDIAIEPSFLVPSEVEILQDLLKAAIADAKLKADKAVQLSVADLLPPGMQMPE